MDEFDLNNLQQILRMNNLFQPQGVSLGGDQQLQQPPPNQQPPFDPAARLNQLYHPQTQASQAFQSALQQMPQRPNPSNFRKVMGAVAGLGAGISPVGIADGQVVGARYNPAAQQQAQESVTSGPYHQKLQDWSAKAGVLERGAKEEDVSNRNQRQLAEQQIQKEINQKKLEEETRKNVAREGDRAQGRSIQEERVYNQSVANSIADYRSKRVRFEKAGNKLLAVHPDGKVEVAKVGDQEIDLGRTDEKNRLEIQHQNRIREIEKRYELMGGLEGQKIEGRKDVKGTEPAPKPVAAKPPTKTTTTITDASGKATGSKTVESGPVTPVTEEMRAKAQKFLEDNGQVATEANIKHALDKGWVK